MLAAFRDRLTGGTEHWPERYESRYRPGRYYEPHNDDERWFLESDEPRCSLLSGGWGSGKSCAGSIKLLERLRRGMSCIAVSPDLQHFKKSFWPIFREWCPWDQVVPKHQRFASKEWEPSSAFQIVFHNRASVYMGGIRDATSWFGGNVSFVLFDEASRYPDDSAFTSLLGRCRIPGPNGEPPQLAITTTPEMNWLHERFGGVVGRDLVDVEEDDPFLDFKREDAMVVRLRTEENLPNLDPDFIETQRRALGPLEFQLFMEAQWVRVDSAEKFVSLTWWDACREQLPPLTRSETLVLAMDASKGGATSLPDTFAVVGVTQHPHRPGDFAVRYCGIWEPQPGELVDYAAVEAEVRRLCRDFSVIEVAYDPYQLHDMMMRFRREGVAHVREFGQAGPRLKADKALQDLVVGRRISHDGNPLLRRHVDNCNIQKHGRGEGIRLIKRSASAKIDAAVALSMACERAAHYIL